MKSSSGSVHVLQWAEHLLILKKHGEKLLKALHQVKQALNCNIQTKTPKKPIPSGSKHSHTNKGSSSLQAKVIGIQQDRSLGLLTDPNQRHVAKMFLKSFPEIPDLSKVAGFSTFQATLSQTLDELKPIYDTFVSLTDFAQSSLLVLQQSVHLMYLDMETTPDLATLFLEVLVLHIATISTYATITPAEKIIVFTGYIKAYQLSTGSIHEKHFDKVVTRLFARYGQSQMISTTPVITTTTSQHHRQWYHLKRMQDDFIMVAPKIAGLIMAMRDVVDDRLLVSVERMRLLAVFSLTPEVNGGLVCNLDDKALQEFAHQNRTANFIAIGALVCPNELVKNSDLCNLVKKVFSYGPVLHLFRDETFNIIEEYEGLAKFNSRIGKFVRSLHDIQTSTLVASWELHMTRREFIRQQLTKILHLSLDERILTSKLAIICSALQFARDEIMWYFSHIAFSPMESNININNSSSNITNTKKRKDTTKFRDPNMAELLWLVKEISNKLHMHEIQIKTQVMYDIKTLLIPKAMQSLNECMRQVFNDDEIISNTPTLMDTSSCREESRNLLKSLLERTVLLSECCVDNTEWVGVCLNAYRLDIARLTVLASLTPTTIRLHSPPPVTKPPTHLSILSTLSAATQWLDTPHAVISSCASLRGLYYHTDELIVHCREALEWQDDRVDAGVEVWRGRRWSGVYAWLAEEFCAGGEESGWFGETFSISTTSILFASDLISLISSHAAAAVHSVAISAVKLARSLHPAETVVWLPRGGSGGSTETLKQKRWGVSGTNTKFSMTDKVCVGEESTLRPMDTAAKELERQKTIARDLVAALMSPSTLFINGADIKPSEKFLEHYAGHFKRFISSSLLCGAESLDSNNTLNENDYTLVKRPTVFALELKAYMGGITFIDSISDIGLCSFLQTILDEQLSVENAKTQIGSKFDLTQSGSAKQHKSSTKGSSIFNSQSLEQSILSAYTSWYVEFSTSKAILLSVNYWPSRSSFVNRNPLSFQSEHYTDVKELQTLCEILGPAGIQFLDEKLVKAMLILLGSTKEMLNQNLEALDKMRAFWTDETKCNEQFKQMKYTKDFISKSVALGFILQFRKSLSLALRSAISTKCPSLFKCVQSAHVTSCALSESVVKHYVDSVANLSGIYENDVLWNESLKFITADPQTWQLLPTLIAATLWQLSLDFEGSVFNPKFEGLENNGHLLAPAFSKLILSIFTLLPTGSAKLSRLDFLRAGINDTIKISSAFLNRLSSHVIEDQAARALDSAVIVLNKFCSLCATPSEFHLPHAICRSALAEQFSTRDFSVTHSLKKNHTVKNFDVPMVSEKKGELLLV